MSWLKGKTVLITGAAYAALKDGAPGSIGFGIATAFAKKGAKLVLTDLDEARLNQAKEKLEAEHGIEVLPLLAKMEKAIDGEALAKQVIDAAIAKFGRLDVLINNAQASVSGLPLAKHSTEQFDLAIYSGLYACFYYMKAAYPYLKESQGHVINFASGAGISGNFGQSSYAAAKEGIRGMSRCAATEWAPDHINVNVICPLAWTRALESWKDAYPEAYEKNVTVPPMGHFGDVELDIGNACVEITHEAFRYMTGQTITLQGGTGLRP
ncbi:MAG: SDR family oxidoreductase [Eubacteriales bacterium]|nr:SDR family oxidoreductase [Eubacteriales bacterium]